MDNNKLFKQKLNTILSKFINFTSKPKHDNLIVDASESKKIIKRRNAISPSDKSSRMIVNILEEVESNMQDNNFDFNIYLKCFIHELRTPLASLNIGFDLLKDNCTEIQKKEIHRDIKNSFEFIDKILTKFSIIQDSNIKLNDFEPFSITKLLQDVKNILPRNLEFHNIIFENYISTTINDWYMGDPHNLAHVIINLLKNAVKYQNLESKNIITIHVTKKESNNIKPRSPSTPNTTKKSKRINTFSVRTSEKLESIQIDISDNNNHILPNIKENLFKTFNSTSGSGLGLYICKSIIDLYNGTINHEYIQPIGNKFIINLTLERCNKITPRPISRIPSLIVLNLKVTKTFNVILIDDNQLNCKMLYQLLQRYTFFDKIETCLNGTEGISIVENMRDNLDIIFLDKYMPEMDGLSVAKCLRNMKYDKLIFGLSGIDTLEEIEEFINSGVDYVFTKPLNKNKLDLIIKFLLEYDTQRNDKLKIKLINNRLVWS